MGSAQRVPIVSRSACPRSISTQEEPHGEHHASVRPSNGHPELDGVQRPRPGLDCAPFQTPGAVSFIAYRTADGASPNTMAMLDFRTLDEAKKAVASDHLKAVLAELRATRADPKVLIVERSPFTPEPIRPST